jgi:predicted DNA-binding transcriptional regulator AlpA
MTGIASSTTTTHSRGSCLDVRAAAKYLGICPGTLDNWRSQGRGPRYVRIGSRICYRVVHLEEYLEANTVDSEGECGN